MRYLLLAAALACADSPHAAHWRAAAGPLPDSWANGSWEVINLSHNSLEARPCHLPGSA